MANVYIKTTKITETKNKIKGSVKLSDGSTTKFEVVKGGEWNQWGNSTNNLCITVPLMERLQLQSL